MQNNFNFTWFSQGVHGDNPDSETLMTSLTHDNVKAT